MQIPRSLFCLKPLMFICVHVLPTKDTSVLGLLRWLSSKESACYYRRCRRHGFDPWVEKITLEKEMGTHASILAWEIPWIQEPGGC